MHQQACQCRGLPTFTVVVRFAVLSREVHDAAIRFLVGALCSEGGRFLGLAALESLAPILARKYNVTHIFDANICRMLKLSNKDIEDRFSAAERVNIVASKGKADETVLAVDDDDPHTFVLSNDRFGDYPDKLAVKEGRVLRHEIVGWAAYIHDLQIEAKFEITPDVRKV